MPVHATCDHQFLTTSAHIRNPYELHSTNTFLIFTTDLEAFSLANEIPKAASAVIAPSGGD